MRLLLPVCVVIVLVACHRMPVPESSLPLTVPAPDAGMQVASLPDTTAVFTTASGGRVSFRVEVADTPETRARGLMFRRSLALDRGMVFVFPVDDVHTFYMKNTYVPLDMIFVGSDGIVVGVVENARPLTLESRRVERPSRYVVELPAFTARNRGIAQGDQLLLEPALAGD